MTPNALFPFAFLVVVHMSLAVCSALAGAGDAFSTISEIEQALRDSDDEKVALLQRQLVSFQTNALPPIKQALTNSNAKLRVRLMEVLFSVPGDEATDVLLTLAVSDPDNAVSSTAAGMVGKRPIPRSLTPVERQTAIRRLQLASLAGAGPWAVLLAKVKDATPSDARVRVEAVVQRFVADVTHVETNNVAVLAHSYLSPKALVINRLLLAFPHTEPSVSGPILAVREAQAVDPHLKRWLLIARGFSRDASAADELHKLVIDRQLDSSERALALRGYSLAAGAKAIPLLEQILQDRETGLAPTLPPAQNPFNVVARDELYYQKHPESRKEIPGW